LEAAVREAAQPGPQPSPLPLLPNLLALPRQPDAAVGGAHGEPRHEVETSSYGLLQEVVRPYVQRFGLNEDQAAVLRHCATWYPAVLPRMVSRKGGGARGGAGAGRSGRGASERERGQEGLHDARGEGAGAGQAEREGADTVLLEDDVSDEGVPPGGRRRGGGGARVVDSEEEEGQGECEAVEAEMDGGGERGGGGGGEGPAVPPAPPVCLVHGPFGSGARPLAVPRRYLSTHRAVPPFTRPPSPRPLVASDLCSECALLCRSQPPLSYAPRPRHDPPRPAGKSSLLVALVMLLTRISAAEQATGRRGGSNARGGRRCPDPAAAPAAPLPPLRVLLASHTNVAVDRVLTGLQVKAG
jgi:hypothetical protein